MFFHHHYVLDQHPPGIWKHAQHAALFSFVAAAQHLYGVIAPNINSFMCRRSRHNLDFVIW